MPTCTPPYTKQANTFTAKPNFTTRLYSSFTALCLSYVTCLFQDGDVYVFQDGSQQIIN